MLVINKDEAAALREHFGTGIEIATTSRTKKGGRKNYFVEETSRVLRYLEELRSTQQKKED